jgi:hypothetical protein
MINTPEWSYTRESCLSDKRHRGDGYAQKPSLNLFLRESFHTCQNVSNGYAMISSRGASITSKMSEEKNKANLLMV